MPPAPRQSDRPEPGHYLIRLARGGPFVGASIAFNDVNGWSVMIDGEEQGPDPDPWQLPFMEKVHWFGRASTEAEVKFRIGLKRYQEIHKPDGIAANPRSPINANKYIPI